MRHTIPLGQIVVTPKAQEALRRVGQDPMAYVCRHARGDWGQALTTSEMGENDDAVANGGQVLSAYYYKRSQMLWLETAAEVWVITEADRSKTTVLLPEEY